MFRDGWTRRWKAFSAATLTLDHTCRRTSPNLSTACHRFHKTVPLPLLLPTDPSPPPLRLPSGVRACEAFCRSACARQVYKASPFSAGIRNLAGRVEAITFCLSARLSFQFPVPARRVGVVVVGGGWFKSSQSRSRKREQNVARTHKDVTSRPCFQCQSLLSSPSAPSETLN